MRLLKIWGVGLAAAALTLTPHAAHAETTAYDDAIAALESLLTITADRDAPLTSSSYHYTRSEQQIMVGLTENAPDYDERGWVDATGSWAATKRNGDEQTTFGKSVCTKRCGDRPKALWWEKVEPRAADRSPVTPVATYRNQAFTMPFLSANDILGYTLDELLWTLDYYSAVPLTVEVQRDTEQQTDSGLAVRDVSYKFSAHDYGIDITFAARLAYTDTLVQSVKYQVEYSATEGDYYSISESLKIGELVKNPREPNLSTAWSGAKILDRELRTSSRDVAQKLARAMNKEARKSKTPVSQEWILDHLDRNVAVAARRVTSPVSGLLVSVHPATEAGEARVIVEAIDWEPHLSGLTLPTGPAYSFNVTARNGKVTAGPLERDTTFAVATSMIGDHT